jgi:hypothetical protein
LEGTQRLFDAMVTAPLRRAYADLRAARGRSSPCPDLDDDETVNASHVSQAIMLRCLDRTSAGALEDRRREPLPGA